MKLKVLFVVVLCLGLQSVWAETVLPWGADVPWQMKYVQPEEWVDPVVDGAGRKWTQLGYDDSQWETLTGPMANNYNQEHVDIFNYTWKGDDKCFYLRRTFTLDQVNSDGYTFATIHDDEIQVYINGQLVIDGRHAIEYFESFFLDSSLFHDGENQLAIYYVGGPGMNYLDYALFSGDGYNRGNHYSEKNAGIELNHIVYTLDVEQGEAVCQGWASGYQPTEAPQIESTISIDGKDYPVTAIGYYAFMDIDKHWDITIPEGIKYIYDFAFWDSRDIGHISFPSTLVFLQYGTIASRIESVSVAEGNPVFDSRDNCNAVIETATNKAMIVCDINTLPTSVTILGGKSICRDFDVFSIPNHIIKTEDNFLGGEILNTLKIPSSLTDISAPMTIQSPNTIIIDADNPKYYTEGNCIIEKGTNKLIATWENSQIPSYITSFGRNALYRYSGSVTLSEKNPKLWNYDGEALGDLSSLKVPKGTIPYYLYQGWDKSPFKTITDGTDTYYCHGEGDTWFAPHIECVNYPSTSAGEELTLSVVLNNDRPVTAFQFDLYLPEGLEVVNGDDIRLSTIRTNELNHILSSEKMPNGAWRVRCYSNNDDVFTGYEGEVCTIHVRVKSNMHNTGIPVIFKNVITNHVNECGEKDHIDREELTAYINFFTPKYHPSDDANTLSATMPSMLLTGDNSYMSLNLTNEDQVIMAEFYLQLPEGISIANDEDDYPDVTINSERANKHRLEVEQVSDGLYHFLCYSSNNSAFKGNEGELFHLKLIVDENMAPGTYQGAIRNVLMSDSERNELSHPDYTFDIVVTDIKLGDANGDGYINGLDIVDLIDYMMNRPSSNFIFATADITGDGQLNGMDLVKMVSLVMSQSLQSASARSLAPSQDHKDATLDAQLQALSSTEAQLGVLSSDEFILTQFVVELSDDSQLVNVNSDLLHVASWKSLGNGRYAVIVYSARNESFISNDALVSFKISGTGSISVRDMMVVDFDRNEHRPTIVGNGDATGLENITGTYDDQTHSFDLQGRKVSGNAAKGIVIINGKKEIVK